MTPLSITAQTTYAELLEQLIELDARRSIGAVPGSFVDKELASGTYVYFQYSLPGGTVRQVYVGRKSKELESLIKRYGKERAAASVDRASIDALCGALRGAGAAPTDAASARLEAGRVELHHRTSGEG